MELLANLPRGPAKDFPPMFQPQEVRIGAGVRLVPVQHR